MSLDTFPSDYPPSSAFLVGWRVASALARRLWEAYVDCLWYFQPNSWVGRLASTFRILAVILVFPVVLLTLLDVTSYVIARTLGIVDDIKASTIDPDADIPSAGSVISPPNDAQTQIPVSVAVQVPMSASTRAQKVKTKAMNTSSTNTGTDMNANTSSIGASVPASEGYDLLGSEELNERRAEQGCASERAVGMSSSSSVNVSLSAVRGHDLATAPPMVIRRQTQQHRVQMDERQQHQEQENATRVHSVDDDDCSDREATRSDAVLSSHHHAYYFAGEDDLRLAGEGVFSPAVSMPPSPLTPRMPLHALTTSAEGNDYDGREVLGQVGEGGAAVFRRRVQGMRGDEPDHHT